MVLVAHQPVDARGTLPEPMRQRLEQQLVRHSAIAAGCEPAAAVVIERQRLRSLIDAQGAERRREAWHFMVCGRQHAAQLQWWYDGGELRTQLSRIAVPDEPARAAGDGEPRRDPVATEQVMARIGADQLARRGCRIVLASPRGIEPIHGSTVDPSRSEHWRVRACGDEQHYTVRFDDSGTPIEVTPAAAR